MTDITLPRATVQALLDSHDPAEVLALIRTALAQPQQAEPADKQRLDWYEANTDKLVQIGPNWYRREGYQQPIVKVGRVFRQAIDAAMRDAGIDAVEAQPDTQPLKKSKPLRRCASGSDGDCFHVQCPQNRDGEPHKTGRHCPLDKETNDE